MVSWSAMMAPFILNEVLSLNAQEFENGLALFFPDKLLNEVLSLNAQEFESYKARTETLTDPQ